MNLIKLSTKFYPYTPAELQRDNPNVSFPSDMTGVDLRDFDAALVTTDDPPDYDPETEKIEPQLPAEINGVWRIRWTKTPLTPKEIKERSPINWSEFNSFMLSDAMFKTYRDIVRAADGDLNSALFNSYSLISSNGTEAFSLVWELWCVTATISSQDRETIAVKAEDFNLPGNVIDVIRGTNV